MSEKASSTVRIAEHLHFDFADTNTGNFEVDTSKYDQKLSWQNLLAASKLSCSCARGQAVSANELVDSMAKVSFAEWCFGLWRGQPDSILSEIWVQGKPLEVVQGSMTRSVDLSLHCDGVEFHFSSY